MSKDSSVISLLKRRMKDKTQLKPQVEIPVIKNDLHNLSKEQDIVIWLGHSSYFIQVDGKEF